MNSKRVGTKPEITKLISDGGAGAISAQAGEVLTLMASSMSNEEWDKLQTTMLEHEKKTIESNPDFNFPLIVFVARASLSAFSVKVISSSPPDITIGFDSTVLSFFTIFLAD